MRRLKGCSASAFVGTSLAYAASSDMGDGMDPDEGLDLLVQRLGEGGDMGVGEVRYHPRP
jgi:hypothetical protein